MRPISGALVAAHHVCPGCQPAGPHTRLTFWGPRVVSGGRGRREFLPSPPRATYECFICCLSIHGLRPWTRGVVLWRDSPSDIRFLCPVPCASARLCQSPESSCYHLRAGCVFSVVWYVLQSALPDSKTWVVVSFCLSLSLSLSVCVSVSPTLSLPLSVSLQTSPFTPHTTLQRWIVVKPGPKLLNTGQLHPLRHPKRLSITLGGMCS